MASGTRNGGGHSSPRLGRNCMAIPAEADGEEREVVVGLGELERLPCEAQQSKHSVTTCTRARHARSASAACHLHERHVLRSLSLVHLPMMMSG